MRGPEIVSLIRHDKSVYNALKPLKEASSLYQEFVRAYEENPDSDKCFHLAIEVKEHFSFPYTDRDTPLVDGAGIQSETMAKNLEKKIELPDIIYVSPYERTIETFEKMIIGWPQLMEVKTVMDERIIEQNYGLASLYNDWRIFNVLHPDQRELYRQQGTFNYRYPQGENVPDVMKRANSWTNTLNRDNKGQNILAITHHLFILAFMANIENLGEKEFLRLNSEQKPINAGVTIYKAKPDKGANSRLALDVYNAKLY